MFQSYGGSADGGYGYGYGLGAALVQSKDFNCNASICYAIGAANDTLFKQLQKNINTLSKAAGIAPLVVDGFIGDKTVTALQAIGKLGLQSPPTTKQQVAINAAELNAKLMGIATTQAAQGKPLAPPGNEIVYQAATAHPSAPSTASTAAISPMQLPVTSSAAAALPQPKSKTLWWILGGLAVVGAIGGVGYVVYRRRRA